MSVMNVMRSWLNFRDWQIWQKLVCIGVPFLLPITILSYFAIANDLETIRVAQKEKDGVEFIRAVRLARQHVQQHRGLSAGFLGGDQAQKGPLLDKQAEVDRDFQALDALDAKFGAAYHTAKNWAKAKNDWQDLKAKLFKLTPDDSNTLHTDLHAVVFEMARDAAEYSTLELDPQSEAFYIQDTITNRLPLTAESLGQTRARAAAFASRGKITPAEKIALAVPLAQMRAARANVVRNMASISRANPTAYAKIEGAFKEYIGATDVYADFLTDNLLNKEEALTVTSREVIDIATRTIDKNFNVFDTSYPVLLQLLNDRISTARSNLVVIAVGIITGVLFVSLIAYLVTRSITNQVNSITGMFSKIGLGDFSARAEVQSSDELGTMAGSLNAMLDNTLSLMQSQEEKEQIQKSISKLLVEVSGVANGDLTKEAEVSTDVTGAIADSFNYMIEQLRKVISDVQDSTVQVSSSANEIHATAEHLASGTESQAEQIVNTSAAIDEMAVSIQQVSDNAALSTNVAQQALQNAKQGTEAVYNTIDGMNRIRDQVQETAKRIKRLGESSQEIGQIIQLIDDIADRTSILALNASIQAAMAGDAGRGFAVVAEEVERLAVRSTDATKKIATLVKTIQSETGEAVNAMEKGIKEVVDGSKLANQAGKSLTEIEGVSKQLADLIQSISLASKQQARGSEALAKSMSEISQITQQTAAGTKQAAVSVNGLASLADELRSSVSTFRLPGRAAQAPVTNGKTNGHANGKDGKDGKEGKRMLQPLKAARS